MAFPFDIWRSANLLLKQHGEEAPILAALRADEMLASGDLNGCRVWFRIIEAIEWLLKKQSSTTVH